MTQSSPPQLSNQLTEHTKLLQKVAFISGDGGVARVLVLQRAEGEGSRPGCWDLPGGNAQWPTAIANIENPHLEAITREIAEETGVVVPETAFSQERLVHVFTFLEQEKQVYTVYFGWYLREVLPAGVPVVLEPSEHQAQRWVTLDEARALNYGQAGGFVLTTIERAFGAKQ